MSCNAGKEEPVGSRASSRSSCSSRSVDHGSCGTSASWTRPRRSQPWGCRSETLTPAPEPARYCAAVSQENVETARAVVTAVAQMDVSRLLELTDADVEWQSFLAQLGEGGV